jgi:hypothetical protein
MRARQLLIMMVALAIEIVAGVATEKTLTRVVDRHEGRTAAR